MRTFNDAIYAVRESLESERPDNEKRIDALSNSNSNSK